MIFFNLGLIINKVISIIFYSLFWGRLLDLVLVFVLKFQIAKYIGRFMPIFIFSVEMTLFYYLNELEKRGGYGDF